MIEEEFVKDNFEEKESEVFTRGFAKMVAEAVREAYGTNNDAPSKTEIVNVPIVKTDTKEGFEKVASQISVLEKKLIEALSHPEVQKVVGEVKANIEFPQIQKIVGEVFAKVAFPEVQKIEGEVKADVDFPEIQKVAGGVNILNLPIGEGVSPDSKKADPTKYIPVRLTDGKKFYIGLQSLSNNVANMRVSRLGVPPHDYITALYPNATTEQYTYRSGGQNGEVVAVVTIGYTDSNKTTLSYVQKV